MASPSKNEQHSGSVSGFSSSGNPIVNKGTWDKRAVVVVSDSDGISRGDKITFTIQKEHSDHYQSAPVGEGAAKVSKPDYSSSPNISIHHDGKYGESVGDTRSQKQTNASISEREFNPKTHGAPEVSKDKRERKFLRQDDEDES